MATWDDVDRLARALPEVEDGTTFGNRAWKVRGKLFAWVRPLRPKEEAELRDRGDPVPDGPVLALRTEHFVAKEALLQTEPDVLFTVSHFDRTPAVLARLDRLQPELLEELITEAWLARAPPSLHLGDDQHEDG